MFPFKSQITRRRSDARSNRRGAKQRNAVRSRRLSIESLESRQLLSAMPLKFYVVDDATTNISFRYGKTGTSQGSSALVAANAAPRGTTSMIGVDKAWVIDANRNVYVYNATGVLLGSWSAGSMANNAAPEGIATDGTDIWIVDSKSDKVYRYAGAANRLSGTQNAASSFGLSNSNSTDMVTDGYSLWVADDGPKADKVYRYNLAGGYLVGSWTIDAANKAPTGIALDPAHIGDMWIADSGTDRVYKYTAAASRDAGSQAAAASFSLGTSNKNPQGLAVAGRPWAETPYEVEWVRQFGTAADDWGRGVTTDSSGNIYLSGVVDGSASGATVGTPYLARYNAAGNLIWQHNSVDQIGHEAVRVAADVAGNVFQVVSPGADGAPASLNNYGPDGTRRWTTYLSPGESIFSVTVDDLGYAYMASYIWDGNIFVRKFDGATGNILWTTPIASGGTNNSTGISADHQGNIYVAAYTSGALLGPNAGSYDGVLLKLSDAGDVLWARQFGTPDADYAFIVTADPFGNAYISGQTRGSLGGTLAGDQDNFLLKYDSAGNEVWRTQFGTSGSDSSSSGWIDAQGNIYRAMTTTGALGGPHYGDSDIVVLKYDPSGSIRWATQFGTPGLDGTTGGIWGDAQGNLYVAGRTSGSLLGGTNAGGADAVLIKLSPPGSGAGSGTGASLDLGAAPTISPALPTSGTANTQRRPFLPAERPTVLASTNAQIVKLNLLNAAAPAVALARDQAFESLAQVRTYAPAKRALITATVDLDGDADAGAGGQYRRLDDTALDIAIAGLH